jgi:hypothetical protein
MDPGAQSAGHEGKDDALRRECFDQDSGGRDGGDVPGPGQPQYARLAVQIAKPNSRHAR